MDLTTVLTVVNILDKTKGLFDWFTGVSQGEHLRRALAEIERTKTEVKRLSDRVLWAPTLLQATPHGESSTRLSNGEIDLVRRINASSPNEGGQVLISAVSQTPLRLRQAFGKDPFEVLIDARPENRVKQPLDPDLVPVRFFDGGQHFIGWQKRGALPSLFDCDFNPLGQAHENSTREEHRSISNTTQPTHVASWSTRDLAVYHINQNSISDSIFGIAKSWFATDIDQIFQTGVMRLRAQRIELYLSSRTSSPWVSLDAAEFADLAEPFGEPQDAFGFFITLVHQKPSILHDDVTHEKRHFVLTKATEVGTSEAQIQFAKWIRAYCPGWAARSK